MKFKRTLLSLGALSAVVAPVATVVSCGADSIVYSVAIDNAKDKNYILATQDANYQPVMFKTDSKLVWDVSADDAGNKIAFEKAFKDQKISPGVKSGKDYKNGLEWLLLDLMQAGDRNQDLSITMSGTSSSVITEIEQASLEAKKDDFDPAAVADTKLYKFTMAKDADSLTKGTQVFADKTIVNPAKDAKVTQKVSDFTSANFYTLNDKGKYVKKIFNSATELNAEITTKTISGTYKFAKADVKGGKDTMKAKILEQGLYTFDKEANTYKWKDIGYKFNQFFANVLLARYDKTKKTFTAKATTDNEFKAAVDAMYAKIK